MSQVASTVMGTITSPRPGPGITGPGPLSARFSRLGAVDEFHREPGGLELSMGPILLRSVLSKGAEIHMLQISSDSRMVLGFVI